MPQTRQPLKVGGFPWLFGCFLIIVFFLSYHDVDITSRAASEYNPSPEDIVATVSQGQVPRRIALLSLGLVSVVSLFRYRANRRLIINSSLAGLFVAFIAWALVSPLWADEPSQSFKRLTGFAILTIAAAAVVRRLSARNFVLWIFLATSAFLCIGVFAELYGGILQPLTPGYRFAGSLHPNNQGVNCALLLLSAVAAPDLLQRWHRFFWSSGAVSFVFLILTGSRTSLGAALLAIAVYLGAVRSRAIKLKAALGMGAIAILLLLAMGAGMISGSKKALLLNRDDDASSIDTFTGRTSIWRDVTPYILQKPVLGHGYGGFWTPTHINKVSDQEEWGVGSSHSAYLDFTLELGGVGVFGYICLLGYGIVEAVRSFNRTQNPIYPFCAAALLFCVVHSFFESEIVQGSMLLFLWMVTLMRLAFLPLERVRGVVAKVGPIRAAHAMPAQPYGPFVVD